MSFLVQSVVFLGAAVLVVPLFQRLKMGSVLGYLAVGIVIGPWFLGLVDDVDDVLHVAELGVVLLLFIIGLELKPARLWVMRRSVFGLGATQVVLTGIALSGCAYLLGQSLSISVVLGFGLALSSTAFVLQTLAEKGELTSQHGRAAFSVLLFQDIAIIPMVALLPVLSAGSGHEGMASTVHGTKVLGVLFVVVLAGRYVLNPALRLVAAHSSREIFVALGLFIVLGVALLMQSIGLSMALGAFVAGVLLADSEYRHELEATIEPFKGLLLGLFFIAVGMSANLGLILHQPVTVMALVLGLLVVKFTVLMLISAGTGRSAAVSASLSLSLAQGGEFAFVLFTAAGITGLFEPELVQISIVVVTLSMALSPLLFLLDERVVRPRLTPAAEPQYDHIDAPMPEVIVAGFGRFGQIVGRVLRVRNVAFTSLDSNPQQVGVVRRFGQQTYFGDVGRVDLLRAAGAEQAKILVVTVGDVATSLKVVELAKRHFPHLSIYARARNRRHVHQLMDLGVKHFVRETVLSSLWLTGEVLKGVGVDDASAKHTVDTFFVHDRKTLQDQHAVYRDETKMIQSATEAAQELEELLRSDRELAAEDTEPGEQAEEGRSAG